MTCRICYEPTGELVSVCGCTGTHAHVHIECIQKWIDISNKHTCELCQKPFSHRKLRQSHSTCEFVFVVPTAVGMFHGTITWVSLFEHLATEILIIETLCCLILTAGVYTVKKVAPWKLYACFYAAFLISNIPPLWLVPVTAYNLNILVPHLFNLTIALVFIVYHRKNIWARNFDCNQI